MCPVRLHLIEGVYPIFLLYIEIPVIMKPYLKIKNIGAIKEALIEIYKVNIFIGPQSSGKSTIAKIISFCQWLEKDVLIHQGKNHIDSTYWEKNLFTYHKIGSYFNKESNIEYIGDIVSFIFHSPDSFTVDARNLDKETMRKITYIPSERNYVNIPNISSLPMNDDYIRDFIFDWLLIRNKYSQEAPQDIIDLGVQYHYDKNRGDIITLGNGKDINLNEASSGLQAVIPLLVSLSYSTEWIYSHNQDLSFDKFSTLHKTFIKEIYKKDDIPSIMFEDAKLKQITAELFSSLQQVNNEVNIPEDLKDAANLVNRLGRPHSTFMIIEEPEENLFPSTQYELIKHIFVAINRNKENALVMTTHSPYIMTSINNLIQAGNIIKSNEATEEQINSIIRSNAYINYEDVSAISILDGYVHSMKDDEFQLISAISLDTASDIINEDFEKLLNL